MKNPWLLFPEGISPGNTSYYGARYSIDAHLSGLYSRVISPASNWKTGFCYPINISFVSSIRPTEVIEQCSSCSKLYESDGVRYVVNHFVISCLNKFKYFCKLLTESVFYFYSIGIRRAGGSIYSCVIRFGKALCRISTSRRWCYWTFVTFGESLFRAKRCRTQ